jgi:hypothetical protein
MQLVAPSLFEYVPAGQFSHVPLMKFVYVPDLQIHFDLLSFRLVGSIHFSHVYFVILLLYSSSEHRIHDPSFISYPSPHEQNPSVSDVVGEVHDA